MQNKYAEIILPIPLNNTFTYSVKETNIYCGCRVLVEFGSKKLYTGIVRSLHNTKPNYKVKNIISAIDEEPIIDEKTFKFWEWISDYYMCTTGDVYKAALPSGLRIESETILEPVENYTDISKLSENQNKVFKIIFNYGKISAKQTENFFPDLNIYKIVKELIDIKAVKSKETAKNRYSQKTKTFISINKKYLSKEGFNEAFNLLSGSPKQLEIFLYLSKQIKDIEKPELAKVFRSSYPQIKSLVEKNVFKEQELIIDRYNNEDTEIKDSHNLNSFQTTALENIKESFEKHNVTLFNGITSSGKTEIYIKLIEDTINRKKRALYLLPEIALTTQIISRLKHVFGKKIAIFHSKLNDNERVEIWQKIKNNEFDIVLTVRSGIFLPIKDLGLIIVDEEHENTYKQFDPAPRYHARDSVIYLASQNNAKVLLGTATPSIESMYNAKINKYGYVYLNKRYKEIHLPEISIIDMREARKKNLIKGLFSKALIEQIDEALKLNEQIILFQNRRGYSPFIQCKTCGWIPECNNCDVSLTYHKYLNQLNCHYCGSVKHMPEKCDACGSYDIATKGFGTEKIEDELKELFPGIRTARLDLDSTRNKKSHEEIIEQFEIHNIDILIGTQMVSKGLNFENVNLVGIMNADNMLNYPDFRSFERSFHLITQVSGRAGRSKKQGKVLIQTSNPDHDILQNILNNDYNKMYEDQIIERKNYKYPPFYKLIELTSKDKNKDKVHRFSVNLYKNLYNKLGERVLNPFDPVINKIQNLYIKKLIIKIETNKSLNKAKTIINEEINKLNSDKEYKSVIINKNVDPY